MKLGVSSAAAPHADLDTLVDACVYRGLAVLELRVGDGHGLGAERAPTDLAAAPSHVSAAGIAIAGVRVGNHNELVQAAALARVLDASVILAGDTPVAARIDHVRELAGGDVRIMVEVSGPSAGWLATIAEAGVEFAWTIDSRTTDPAADMEAMLAAGMLPAYVRMAGGVGAESTMGEGRGLGPVMACLTLARYAGPLILAPGPVPYRIAWEQWLGSRSGWGCGTAAEKRDRVQLTSGVRGGAA